MKYGSVSGSTTTNTSSAVGCVAVVETRTGSGSGGGGEAPLRVRQLAVVFAPARAAPALLTLENGAPWIGRDPEATIALEDDEASRRHAELHRDPAADRWVIR